MGKIALSIPGFPDITSPLPSGVPTGGLSTTGQSVILTFLILFVIAAIFFALWSILKGGLGLIQSVGHKEAIQRGRERILFTLLGLFMLIISFLLIRAFGAALQIDLLCIVFKPLSKCN